MNEPTQRILVLNQFAWPDAAATAQLLDDVVRSLGVRPGMEVTIVAGAQCYRRQEESAPPPARFVRIPGPPVGRSKYGRLLAWMTYYVGVMGYCLVGPKHDVVISMTTPPLLSMAGWLAQRLRGSRHVIWEMDVYPDIMEAAGMMKRGSWMSSLLRSGANRLRTAADSILVLGSCMKRRLVDQGVPERKVVVCENWAPFHGQVTSTHLPPLGTVRLLYSGNLGVAHDVDTLKDALLSLQKLPAAEDRFEFVMAADGGRKREFQQWCVDNAINIVKFVPLVNRETLGMHLASCHLGLVTQTTESLGCVVPSKFYGLLAAGRPVVYVGPGSSEVAQVIERTECGFQVEPGDSHKLVDVLLNVEANPQTLYTCAQRAAFLGNHAYSASAGVARIQAALAPVLASSALESLSALSRFAGRANTIETVKPRVS